jgi:hypothetical protein|tara:strand:- start:175 stop:366 length:192 start_codon:yes stop_codon:yes gene_type:complete
MTKELLTEKEVSEKYGLNIRTLQKDRWMGSGLTYVKIRRRILYRTEDVEKYIAKHVVGSHRYD